MVGNISVEMAKIGSRMYFRISYFASSANRAIHSPGERRGKARAAGMVVLAIMISLSQYLFTTEVTENTEIEKIWKPQSPQCPPW